MRKVFIASLVSLALGAPAMSEAAMLSFGCITHTSAVNCQTGQTQLSMEALAAGSGVQFIFRNIGAAASSITDVYFDDGSLLALASITNGTGVKFSQDASPPNLPGGNNASPPFEVTAGFSADSDAPVQPNGVNPGEVLTIFFTLQSGHTFNDVLSELSSGELRAGIHVQGFANGGSESFVNLTPVPLPAGVGLLLGSLGALVLTMRRKRAAEIR
jgi:hypothetical protein